MWTAPRLTCLLKAGLPSVQALVRETGRTVLEIEHQLDMHDDPLGYVPRQTSHKEHFMNSYLVQVMEVRYYSNSDRDNKKWYKQRREAKIVN